MIYDIQVNTESYRSTNFNGISQEEMKTMLHISLRNGYTVTVMEHKDPEAEEPADE